MCYHYQLEEEAERLEELFNAVFESESPYEKNHFNAFNFPRTPVIANSKPDLIQEYYWGLIPSWAKDDSIRKYTLNAKVETLQEKPSFKNVINNRCLVLADGFTEWQWLDPKGKKKQAYVITLPDEEPFAFAGLWSEWMNPADGQSIFTYTIVTTEATGLMAEIHNSKKRMPIILSKEQESEWLAKINHKEFSHNQIELKAEKIEPFQNTLF